VGDEVEVLEGGLTRPATGAAPERARVAQAPAERQDLDPPLCFESALWPSIPSILMK
jgi:hypothetical protein